MIKILFVIVGIFFILSLTLLLITSPEYEVFNCIKPITLVQFSGFVTFALFLNLIKPFFKRFDSHQFSILIIIAFLIILGALFEMLWSFGYWFDTYSIKVEQGSPEGSKTLDTLMYAPSDEGENLYREFFYNNRSLNLSAKKNTLFFMMGVYLLYFLINLKGDIK